jgi:hypothetical protein
MIEWAEENRTIDLTWVTGKRGGPGPSCNFVTLAAFWGPTRDLSVLGLGLALVGS